MKYQAVILNFDSKTAKYVGVQRAERSGQKQLVTATRTGATPPHRKPKRG